MVWIRGEGFQNLMIVSGADAMVRADSELEG